MQLMIRVLGYEWRDGKDRFDYEGAYLKIPEDSIPPAYFITAANFKARQKKHIFGYNTPWSTEILFLHFLYVLSQSVFL